MNLKDEILRQHSKTQMQLIVAWVGKRQDRFDELVEHVRGEDETMARRASWAMSQCAEDEPQLADSNLESLIELLEKKGTMHAAIRRHTTKVFQTVPIPEELLARLFDCCMSLLADPNEMVAVQAYSMTILSRICSRHPELVTEVNLVIEQGRPHGTAAYRARGRRTLRELERLAK